MSSRDVEIRTPPPAVAGPHAPQVDRVVVAVIVAFALFVTFRSLAPALLAGEPAPAALASLGLLCLALGLALLPAWRARRARDRRSPDVAIRAPAGRRPLP